MALVNVEFTEFQQNYEQYCKDARESGDIIQIDIPGDMGMYVVSSHAAVNEVLKNDCGSFVHFADYFTAQEGKSEIDQKISNIFSKNLGNNSGMHIELRKDIRNHFNGGGLDQHISFMKETIGEMVENLKRVAAENEGVVDLVQHFSMPLTFLVTSHIIGLEFDNDDDKILRTEQASEAIRLINLLASDEEKTEALKQHDLLNEFIMPQLNKFATDTSGGLRKDCLFYDMGEKLKNGEDAKLENFVELVNGLFQAGLGAVGGFFSLCLHLLLEGDDDNSGEELRAYYLDPERTDEDKREAIAEYIRLVQGKLGGLLPRYANAPGEVQGVTIKENSLVYMSFVSANMDELAFKDPRKAIPDRGVLPKGLSKEELTERRNKRIEKNVSFSYGEHMCPGRRISLTLVRWAIDGLFEAFPNITSEEINIFSEIMGRPSEVTSFYVRLNG